jgi:hypothetical protein
MTRHWRLLLVTTGLAVVTAQAMRSQPQPETEVAVMNYGVGRHSCGRWLAGERAIETSATTHDEYLNAYLRRAWINGYVTAAGDVRLAALVARRMKETSGREVPVLTDSMLRRTDGDGMSAGVTKFCTENPTREIFDAALDVVVNLHRSSPIANR